MSRSSRRWMWALWIAALLVESGACGTTVRSELKTRRVSRLVSASHPLPFLARGRQTPPNTGDDTKGPAAEVLRDACRLEYWMRGRQLGTTLSCHRALLLRRAEALPLAEMTLPWSKGLVHLSGRTQRPDGRVVNLEADDVMVMDTMAFGGTAGDIEREVVFAFPAVTPGSVVEYRTRREFGTWLPTFDHFAPPGLPVREAVFELVTPRGVTVRVDETGFVEGNKVGRRRRWRANDLQPASPEPLQPPKRQLVPRIRTIIATVGPPLLYRQENFFSSWREVVVPQAREIWAAARSAPQPRTGTVDAVWESVQERVHDRGSLTKDKGTYRTATDILISAHGNADERAIVLAGALRRAGFKVGLALLPPAGQDDFEESRIQPLWGADILVALPDEDLLLDPACVGCVPGELAPHHRGRGGIKITPSSVRNAFGVKYFRTAHDAATSKQWPVEVRHTVEIHERGLLARTGSWLVRGDIARGLRNFFAANPLPPAEVQREVKKRFLDSAAEGSLSIEGLDAASGTPLTIHVKDLLLGTAGTTRAGGWIRVQVRSLHGVGWIDRHQAPRTTPIELTAAQSFGHAARVVIPEGYEAVRVPNTRIDSAYGKYVLTSAASKGYVDVVERLEIHAGTLEGKWLVEFDEFLQKVQRARRAAVLLKKKRR